ncbi:MAG TPA: hypothetical protein VGA03_06540, partial [Anaerolineales bacterium]
SESSGSGQTGSTSARWYSHSMRMIGLVEAGVLAPQEQDRLPFQQTLPFLVGFKNGSRGCAKRAVVEEVDIGIQQE